MTNKITVLFIGFLFVSAIAIPVAFFGGLLLPPASVVLPHIVPQSSNLPPIISTHSFPFEQGTITITVPVSDSVYQGAKLADKEVTIYGNISEEVWVPDSYRSMVNDPAQEDLYRALLEEFKQIKDSKGLSDDEYLELMTTFVQSLTYETITDNPVKFPIETVVDGSGDCDDKSLLLAGLLSREGYRVGLMSFGPEAHMAVGVTDDEFQYKNTTYAYIETTNLSFVGVPADILRGGRMLQSDPIIIPIGNGTRTYTSGKETRFINSAYIQSEYEAKRLEPEIKNLEMELRTQQEKITHIEAQMQNLRSSGNIPEYNAHISVHNELVTGYNARLKTYRELFSRYEKTAQVHNYILEHNFDRPGVFKFVQQNMPV
jgi:hypothetical protein